MSTLNRILHEDVDEFVKKVLNGETRAIARLITLIEEGNSEAMNVLAKLHTYTGKAHVIGVTGPPGVGKSCLIDRLIREYRKKGLSVGVLAVDPTSPFTGGALLGDRIRMKEHSTDSGVFIRSMGSRGSLGGLSRATGYAVKVLDASGKDVVIIETVGAGQTQIDVIKYAYTVVLVLMPKLGDEIQAMKTGIYEIGDIFVVNKADQDNADQTVREIEEYVEYDYEKLKERGFHKIWKKPVVKTIAVRGDGIDKLVEEIDNHKNFLVESGMMEKLKMEKNKLEVLEILSQKIYEHVLKKANIDGEFKNVLSKVTSGEVDPYSAANLLLKRFVSS
ncbi:MAG: methylmalonyl Co-A mutase-associated GTPase MeaB [Candidatus Bathyarchaeota archaeon]